MRGSVPSRYSAAEDCAREPGRQIGAQLSIKLDGVPIRRVVSYDISAGVIVRMVINRHGYALRNPAQPAEWLTQTLSGKVEVEWVDDA